MDVLDDDPIKLPYEVQNILYEMTLRYLMEKPDDLLDFCYSFMENLSNERRTQIINPDVGPVEILGEVFTKRRKAICYVHETEEDKELEKVKKSDLVKELITGAIYNLVPFRFLESDELKTIVDVMYQLSVNSGQHVLIQGGQSESFYLIEYGLFSVFVSDGDDVKRVRGYENEGYFCELALLYKSTLQETIIANSPGSLWVLDRSTYKDIINKNAASKWTFLNTLISEVSIFSSLSDEERWRLVESMECLEYENNDIIYYADFAPDGIYFIRSGEVAMSVTDLATGESLVSEKLGVGDYFGDYTLIHDNPLDRTARAVGWVKLAYLSTEAAERVVATVVHTKSELVFQSPHNYPSDAPI